jgi:hypothetical protein
MTRPEPISFADFFAAWSGRRRAEFLVKVRCPYLALPAVSPGSTNVEGSGDPPPTDKVDLTHTVAHWDLQVLLPIMRTRSSATSVTLGRAATNDVVLPDPRISKTQVSLEQSKEDGAWWIRDLGSKNGTKVDLLSVPRAHGVPLRSGARIRIAEAIDAVFLEPEALFSVIERVGRAKLPVPPPRVPRGGA